MPGQGCLASKPDEASHALYTSKLAPSVPRCREPSALPPTLPRKLAQRLGFSHSAALLGNAAWQRCLLAQRLENHENYDFSKI